MVRLCQNRLQGETHIFLSRGEPCSQRPTQMAGNHEADATTQPCVGVTGIGQGTGQGVILTPQFLQLQKLTM